MIHNPIHEKSAYSAWRKALSYVTSHGEVYTDRNKRKCLECLNLQISITDTKRIDEPIRLLSRVKSWLYPDLLDVAKVMLPNVDSQAHKYNYGQRLFSYQQSVNQIDTFVIPKLQQNPYSRKAIAIVVDPKIDSHSTSTITPSILALDFKIRDNLLHVTCMIRSCDLFFGFPANVYQVHTLQEYVAKKINIELGSITFFCNSAHTFGEYESYMKDVFSYL